jgi:hypothetical protein
MNKKEQIQKTIDALLKKQKDAVEYTNKEMSSPKQDLQSIGYWQGYNDAMACAVIAVEHFFKTGVCKCKKCQ